MEYIITAFAIVIISTIIFIAKTYNWLLSEYHKYTYFRSSSPIIERPYRAVDLQTVISYTSMKDYDRYNYPFPAHQFGDHVIRNTEHKQYLIKDSARKLADEMLAQGLIEIDERKDEYGPNPFVNHIMLKVKAYKPMN